MIRLHAAVAITPSNGIGYKGELPWVVDGIKFSKDLAYFRQITTKTKDPSKQNAVIMGKRTWLSIADKYRPLKNRLNIVLTSDSIWGEEYLKPLNVLYANSLDNALEQLNQNDIYKTTIENAVVIGGALLFEETLLHPLCTEFHITQINHEYTCDTYLSETTLAKLVTLQPISTSTDFYENNVAMRMVVYNPSYTSV